jgi:hypothetical protein
MRVRALLPATAILFIACSAEPGKNSAYNSSGFDVAKDEADLQDTVKKGSAPSAAQVILDSDWKAPIDEQLVQVVLDSLRSQLPSTRIIQAKAVSRVWPRCDGAIAEVVSLSAFNYVRQKPVEFFSLFPADIPWQELGFWSDMIAQELIIEYESDPMGAAKEFMIGLNERAMQQGVDIHVEVDRMQRQVLSLITDLAVSPEPR